MGMYHRSILAGINSTPQYLQRRVPNRDIIDTPGIRDDREDEYEENSFLASEDGTASHRMI